MYHIKRVQQAEYPVHQGCLGFLVALLNLNISVRILAQCHFFLPLFVCPYFEHDIKQDTVCKSKQETEFDRMFLLLFANWSNNRRRLLDRECLLERGI